MRNELLNSENDKTRGAFMGAHPIIVKKTIGMQKGFRLNGDRDKSRDIRCVFLDMVNGRVQAGEAVAIGGVRSAFLAG